jgi:hypothetical protein
LYGAKSAEALSKSFLGELFNVADWRSTVARRT